jgi:hypothetical protein
MTAITEETLDIDPGTEISCEAVHGNDEPCGNPAEVRISYACAASGCSARKTAVICGYCLSRFPDEVTAMCPDHGMIIPVLTGLL